MDGLLINFNPNLKKFPRLNLERVRGEKQSVLRAPTREDTDVEKSPIFLHKLFCMFRKMCQPNPDVNVKAYCILSWSCAAFIQHFSWNVIINTHMADQTLPNKAEVNKKQEEVF